MNSTVYIRVDASPEIGMGHLTRCMALAEMLIPYFHIVFVIKNPSEGVSQQVQKSGFQLIPITKENDFIQLLTGKEIVVLDGYHFDAGCQRNIKASGCPLVFIDDLHQGKIIADVIINQAPNASPDLYTTETYTKLCLGTDYVLLRKEFLNNKTKPRQFIPAETLFVCFGGSDFHNLTEKVLLATRLCPAIKYINLVLGIGYQYREELESALAAVPDKKVSVHSNLGPEALIDLIQGSDIAIIPSSSIMWECFAVTTACITGPYVDNQKDYAKFAETSGAALVVNWLTETESDIANSINAITPELAQKQIHVQEELIDGQSPRRIRELFFGLIPGAALRLQKARLEDMALVFNWANDRVVRENAFNTDPIPWENHVNWFSKKITQTDSYFYILYQGNQPAGQIRFDPIEEGYEISYLIDSLHRGQGLGKVIIDLGITELYQALGKPKVKIFARVKRENIASMKVFQSVGFTEIENDTSVAEFIYEF